MPRIGRRKRGAGNSVTPLFIECGSFESRSGGEEDMRKHWILAAMALCAIVPSMLWASDRDEDIARTQKAADVFREIANTPDRGIPDHFLRSAKCVAIIPGTKRLRSCSAAPMDEGWRPAHRSWLERPDLPRGRRRKRGLPNRRIFHRSRAALHERPCFAKA